MLYISMCRSKVLGKGGKVKEWSVSPGQMSSGSWFTFPTPRDPAGGGGRFHRMQGGGTGLEELGLAFCVCCLMALHRGLSTHSSLQTAHCGRRVRCLWRKWVPSWPSVRSPFLSLHAGSQQASHIHSPSSLLWPASVAQPWASYFWILVPSLFQLGMARRSLHFPLSSYWVWRLRLLRDWEFAYKMLGLKVPWDIFLKRN